MDLKLDRPIQHIENVYQSAFLDAPVPMWIIDAADLRFVAVNRCAITRYGYQEDEFLSMTLLDICVPGKTHLPYSDRNSLESGPFKFRCMHRLRSGRRISAYVSSQPTLLGSRQAFVEVLLDRQTSPNQIPPSLKEEFTILTETSTAGVFFYGRDRFHYVNPAMEEITGYTRHELESMHFLDLVHPDHREMMRLRARARKQGNSLASQYELKILTKQGMLRWLDVAPGVIQMDGKQLLVGTAIDITERKQMEEELQRSEELTHRILEAVPSAIIEADQDGQILRANIEAQRAFGKSGLDFLRCTAGDLALAAIYEDGNPVAADQFPFVRCLTTGEDQSPISLGIKRPDGSIAWGMCSAVPLMDISSGQSSGAVLTFLDITQRKKMEDALREEEERYRRFFEDDLTGDFIADTDGNLQACNRTFLTIFGFASNDEARKTRLTSVFESPEAFEETLNTLRTSRKIEYHDRIGRRKDGSTVHIIENLIGLFNEQGDLTGIRGYLFDNTAHKILEQQILEAAKLEGLGRLAGGIAHDFNNLLSIILGYADKLMNAPDVPAPHTTDAKAIFTAARRGANLVKQLLTFARKAQVAFEEMDVNEVLDELVRLLRETFPRTITLELHAGMNLPAISGDHNQIHQSVLNLCVNARDAMPSGGILTIRSFACDGTELQRRFPECSASRYVGISVSDTGRGMDTETRSRIFEPFFTTKELGAGTGLGLAVVHGIAQAHGGFVDVQSTVGAGTTFTLYFPGVTHGEPKAEEEQHFRDPSGGTESLLLVEDEALLRDLVESLLNSKGYTVMTARDGQEAVEIFMQKRDSIQLVVTDLGLPRLGGWEAARIMLKERPDLPVIVATGYLDPDAKQEMTDGGIRDFVQKPYQARELTHRVREVLDRVAKRGVT